MDSRCVTLEKMRKVDAEAAAAAMAKVELKWLEFV